MGQAKDIGPWFRGLRKLKHVLDAVTQHEMVGAWPLSGWQEGAGADFGRILRQFQAEDATNFEIVMRA